MLMKNVTILNYICFETRVHHPFITLTQATSGVSHCGLAIYILKVILSAKEELWKFKYFTMQKYYLQKKKSSKRNQNPSRYHNSITNLKFHHKPKYHLSKILI
jgi:hypothetical protein